MGMGLGSPPTSEGRCEHRRILSKRSDQEGTVPKGPRALRGWVKEAEPPAPVR